MIVNSTAYGRTSCPAFSLVTRFGRPETLIVVLIFQMVQKLYYLPAEFQQVYVFAPLGIHKSISTPRAFLL